MGIKSLTNTIKEAPNSILMKIYINYGKKVAVDEINCYQIF